MCMVNESGSVPCRGTVQESSDLEVCKDMQHIDLSHLYNSSINGHGACPCGARCLPMWGTMLAHVGHGACPKWAQPVSKMCPKRFKDETPEKGMINDQSPDDTSMIL